MRRLVVTFALAALFVGAMPAIASAAAKSVDVELTDGGCPKRLEVPAGKTKFDVKNVSADAVSEFEILQGHRVLGERENLTPGLSGSFTVDLDPGTYVTYCPGGDRERGKLVVTGVAGATQSAAAAQKVGVVLSEFVVKAKPRTVRAGSVKLAVKNVGTLTHEAVLVRSDGTDLPLAADGSVDESALSDDDFVGELEDMGPKDVATLKATLEPGTYTLFCNVVDDESSGTTSHYHEGMHTTITVR